MSEIVKDVAKVLAAALVYESILAAGRAFWPESHLPIAVAFAVVYQFGIWRGEAAQAPSGGGAEK